MHCYASMWVLYVIEKTISIKTGAHVTLAREQMVETDRVIQFDCISYCGIPFLCSIFFICYVLVVDDLSLF